MELRKIWSILVRRIWIIILTFATLMATAVIGIMTVPSTYEAEAKLLIDGRASASLNALWTAMGITKSTDPSDPSDKEIVTKTKLILSSELLKELAEKLQVRDDYDNLVSPKDIVDKKMIPISPSPYVEVEQDEKSTLLLITGGSGDALEAQYLAMALAEIFINKSLEWGNAEFNNAGSYADSQFEKIKINYQAVLKSYESFKIRERTMDLKSETTALISKITSLQDSLYKLNITYQEKRVDQTDSHPDVVAIKNKINLTEKQLQNLMDTSFSNKADRKSADGRYAAPLDQRGEPQKTVEDGTSAAAEKTRGTGVFSSLPAKEMESVRLEAELKAAAEIYYSMLQYKYKVAAAKTMSIANVRLMVPPFKPEKAIFPKKGLTLVVAVFLGIMFGLGFAFLFEYIDTTVKEPADLKKHGIPIIGRPRFIDGTLPASLDTNGPVYESFRSACDGIHIALSGSPAKKMLITSAGVKDGKTSFVANLGILLAREGKRTLLVDADFSGPSLHDIFELSNDKGLAELLESEGMHGDFIKTTVIKGLSVLPCGRCSGDPALMLKSEKMPEVIASLSGRYDVLVFDSAPLARKQDAVFLMRHMDALLLVLKENKSTQQNIAGALETLTQAKISPKGIILYHG